MANPGRQLTPTPDVAPAGVMSPLAVPGKDPDSSVTLPAGPWQRELVSIRQEYFYTTLSGRGRRSLEQVFAQLMEACSSLSHPDQTFRQLLRLVTSLSGFPGYFDILSAHPSLLHRLARLLNAGPLLADFLVQTPLLVDELLDGRNYYALPDRETLRATLVQELRRGGPDAGELKLCLRRFKHSCIVHLLAQDLEGMIPLEEVSDQLTMLAEVLLQSVMELVCETLGESAAPKLAIIGYGKLGSKEMTYGSDTDIIFLLDDTASHDEERISRYARRFNAWLTDYTEAGILYDTDFRLRPYGQSGPLLCSVSAFRNYQQEKAWTWEHQALTRARWCVGDPEVGNAFERIRLDILVRERDPRLLAEEVIAMRNKMLGERRAEAEGFDVKHGRGGIIDVEFIVQYLVLLHSRRHSELADHVGNIKLLRRAALAELIPGGLSEDVANAYRQYRLWLHQYRLHGIEEVRVETRLAATHVKAVTSLWAQLFQPGALESVGVKTPCAG